MAPANTRRTHVTAMKIAGGYAIFGLLWILFSDRLVATAAASESQLTTLQTIKGGVFVLLSAVLIHGMIVIEQRRLIATHEEVETALQQVHILHRILRHNLRNICSIIGGSIDRMDANHGDRAAVVDVLRRQNQRLTTLSEKSRHLRTFLTENVGQPGEHDLKEVVDTAVSEAREKYESVTIHVETPSVALVHAHHLIGGAIEELIENSIEHNNSENPTVWLRVEAEGGWTTVEVEDNGPGIPGGEKSTLRRRFETAMEHSQGLGLWLIHLTIQASNGELRIKESDHGGSRVVVRLPSAE